MPKKMTRNKRRIVPRAPRTHSVKDLLAAGSPGLKRVTDQAARGRFWGEWLAARLPESSRERISGISEREGTLVIFAESAAWSARLRYAVLELEGEIRAADPGLTGIEVRVLPRG